MCSHNRFSVSRLFPTCHYIIWDMLAVNIWNILTARKRGSERRTLRTRFLHYRTSKMKGVVLLGFLLYRKKEHQLINVFHMRGVKLSEVLLNSISVDAIEMFGCLLHLKAFQTIWSLKIWQHKRAAIIFGQFVLIFRHRAILFRYFTLVLCYFALVLRHFALAFRYSALVLRHFALVCFLQNSGKILYDFQRQTCKVRVH